MANVLVYIELSDDQLVEASLEALGEGRRLASAVGATLDALVPCVRLPPAAPGREDVLSVLSQRGADRVMVLSGPHLGGPAIYATHGDAVAETCEDERPLMVLMAATPAGRDLAPRLAARLGAAFVAEPAFEYGPRGELVLSRAVYGGLFRRRLEVNDLERPVVATLSPGCYPQERGEEEAEVVMLSAMPAEGSPVEELARRPDPASSLELSPVVVCAGAGVGSRAGWELVCELARALGGEPAATREACRLGYAPADREVGIGARRIAPRLYVACGASGSARHLGAITSDAEIIAIDRDPDAPIFRVAQYGLVGELHVLLPELVRALNLAEQGRAAQPASPPDAPSTRGP